MSSQITAKHEQTKPTGVDWQPPQKPKPADHSVGSHGWDIEKVMKAAPKLESSAEEIMPPLAHIPQALLQHTDATPLTLLLRTIIFDIEGLKNVRGPCRASFMHATKYII